MQDMKGTCRFYYRPLIAFWDEVSNKEGLQVVPSFFLPLNADLWTLTRKIVVKVAYAKKIFTVGQFENTTGQATLLTRMGKITHFKMLIYFIRIL
jgi:hypothetical protein